MSPLQFDLKRLVRLVDEHSPLAKDACHDFIAKYHADLRYLACYDAARQKSYREMVVRLSDLREELAKARSKK